MFKMEHLWEILRFIKDDEYDITLDQIIRTTSKHEQIISKKYFKTNLDQIAFASDDYKRLREFMIDWYASLRTITTTQKNISSDPFSIADSHLSELFRSFGYTKGLDIVPLVSKSHFFLDLVNFYKKKGAPETIIDILDYYGFSDADLIEYWLIKDSDSNLVFRPESIRKSSTGTTEHLLIDLEYNSVVDSDPHWLYTKQQIEDLIPVNKINLPSKTPYFSLSTNYKLMKLGSTISILSKVVHDEYNRFKNGDSIPYIVSVARLGYTTSLLSLFVSFTYIFNKFLNPTSSYQGNKTHTYIKDLDYSTTDPPIVSNLSPLIQEFETLISRPQTRDERTNNLIIYDNEWGQSKSLHFLSGSDTNESLLTELDPELKNIIDGYFLRNDENTITVYILNAIDIWLRTNIETNIPSLLVSILGFGFKAEVRDIINFFKPFRARLLFLESAFIIDNKLSESIILDNVLGIDHTNIYRDFPNPSINANTIGRNNYDDPNTRYDVGIIDDYIFNKLQSIVNSTIETTDDFKTTISQNTSSNINSNLSDDPNEIHSWQTLQDSKLVVDYEFTEIEDVHTDRLFHGQMSMDEDQIFDELFGHEELFQYVSNYLNDTLQISEDMSIVSKEFIFDNFKSLDNNGSFDQLLRFDDRFIHHTTDIHKDLIRQLNFDITNNHLMDGLNVSYATQTSGFYGMDEGELFDAPMSGRDLFEVHVLPA